MKKCLKKQMKCSVNNDSIPVYGDLRFKVYSGTGDNDYISYAPDTDFPAKIKVIGEGTLNTNGDTELTANSSTAQYIKNVSDIILSVEKKYDVDRIMLEKSEIDLKDLKYLTKLQSLKSFKAFGSISSLSGLTELKTLGLNGAAISGDIATLSTLYQLTEVNMIGCSSVFGSVENMIVPMLSKYDSRTSPYLRLILTSTSCSLHNQNVNAILYVKFTSTTSFIIGTSKDNNDIAEYNNGNWTWK